MSIYSKSFRKSIFNSPNTSLYKIFHLMDKNVKNILDVGCSSGYFGEMLIRTLGCRCYGIEIDDHDANIAKKRLSKVIQKNIEETELSKIFPKSKFDGIIFADILEHLKNPQNILEQTKHILSLNGHVYISIPNVTHKSILLEMITNQWNYEESGILDKTHLKFYSYNGIVDLLESTGFFIEDIDYTSNELPQAFIKKILIKQKIKTSKELLNIFNDPKKNIFQFIIKATKKPIKNYQSYNSKTIRVTPISDWIKDYQDFSDTKKELDNIKSSKFWKIYKFLKK